MDAAPDAVDRSTLTFLEDSVHVTMQAFNESQHEFKHSLSRLGVLACAHLIEAAANACLDSLDLGNGFANDVDRLPFVSKFELFVRIRYPRRSFDRSRREVQGISEIKKVRDSFVHPKGQRIIWQAWSEQESVSVSPQTPTLRLSRIAGYCHPADALASLRATHEFFRYLFKDTCKLGSGRVNSLLFSEDPVPRLDDPLVPYWPRPVLQWLKDHSVPIDYVRIGRGL